MATNDGAWTPQGLDDLLRLFSWDDTENLWWRGRDGPDEGPLEYFVNCNDTFAYACADVERIHPSDLPDLVAAKPQSRLWWAELWVARKRRAVPISQFLSLMDDAEQALFRDVTN